MLKETLSMEKEYTRSNYEFMRRFKRDKYVKRDNISNEKQFESTFSVLWSSKQANLTICHPRAKSVKSLHRNSSYITKSSQLTPKSGITSLYLK